MLAPSVVTWSDQRFEPDFTIKPAPSLGDWIRFAAWEDYSGNVPTPVLEARWGPVMVLSHDCEIDKEFNREVDRMVREGIDERRAIEDASADEDLDTRLVIAPVLPYDEFPEADHAGIRSGQRIGFLPLPPTDVFDGEETVVDLGRPSCVDRQLLTRFERLLSLAGPQVGVLRYKLSEAYSSRALAAISEIEALVGQTIVGVEALPRSSKKSSLIMHLEDGTATHLEIRKPREGIGSVVKRIWPK